MKNLVILIGNLGRDSEMRTIENGQTVTNFSLATSESYKDKSGEWQSTTEWHNIVVWGKMAESAARLKKGGLVYVEGKVSYRKYQDGDGNNRYRTDIVAKTFRSLDKKPSSDSGAFPKSNDPILTTGEGQWAGNSHDVPDLPF